MNPDETQADPTKLRITVDEANQLTTIELPWGQTLSITGRAQTLEISDQHKNRIQLSASGIKLSSLTDIEIEAAGSLTLKAGSEAAISALNINAHAKVGLTAKGSATAELSAGGQTTLKGGLVLIN